MNISKVVVVIGLLTGLLLITSVSAKSGWQFTEQTCITSDGLLLHAWLGVSSGSNKPSPGKHPLFLLLPMMGKSHDSYKSFINELSYFLQSDTLYQKQPLPYLLSFDLRGHGKSTSLNNNTISYRSMSHEDFAKMPQDVAEMTRQVIADTSLHIDTNNIVAIGASIGANTAIMLTRLLPGITKVVMLSPGIDYRGLRPAQALKAFTGRSLIFVSKRDTYSASSSQKLSAVNRRCQLNVFDGKNHGTNIINNNSEAMNKLLRWLFMK